MTNPTHLHLLLNHFPTIAFLVALALYAGAWYVKSRDLLQASLVVFAGVALLTVPAYMTGNAAQVNIQDMDGISITRIETHEGAAFVALVLIELVGALAWYGLWQMRRRGALSNGLSAVIGVLALVAFGVTSRAATIGGEIRHSELQGAVEPGFVGPLARTVGNYVRDTPYAWIAAETVHFVGLTLLIGVVGVIALRLLNIIRGVPASALDRLLPWAMLGFVLNTMTGMFFIAAQYGQYVGSAAIYYKLACVLVAAAAGIWFAVDRSWLVEKDETAPALSRSIAGVGFVFWMAVLFWGMMLPFIGTAF